MNCLITKTLKLNKTKGKSFSVIRRYLKMIYKIDVSQAVLDARIAGSELSATLTGSYGPSGSIA